MWHILFRAIDGDKAKIIPSCATATRSEAIRFFNGILEKAAENIEGHLLPCSEKGGLVRWREAFLMRQTGVTEKPVDYFLVPKTLTGPDHIDKQGKSDGQWQFAVSGEILAIKRGVDILPALRKKTGNELQ
nr:hypothetical protein [uncultured Desulfobulbus sp.]